jgi:hypothetical protein
MVEVNGMFLHQRKLLLLSSIPKTSPVYVWNGVGFVVSGVLFRVVWHAWVVYRLWIERGDFYAVEHWWVAFGCMCVINVLNVQLLHSVVQLDKKELVGYFKGKRD